MLQLFSAATTTWQRGEAQIDAFREARGALQLMARDLGTTIQLSLVQANGTITTANPLLPTLVLNRYPSPSTLGGDGTSSADSMNEEVYALTQTIDQPTPSPVPPPSPAPQRPPGLCAVGYFCQWMPDLTATPEARRRAPSAFALMRQYLNGDGTSARIQAAVRNNGPQTRLSFLQLFERTSLVPGSVPGTNPPTANATLLASYVWDLKFRIDTNTAVSGDGESPVSATDHSDFPTPTPPGTPAPARLYDGVSPPYPGSLPAYLEIRFKAMSNNASRRLGGVIADRADWITPLPGKTGTPFYTKYVLSNAQQFVLRVPLINSNPSSATP